MQTSKDYDGKPVDLEGFESRFYPEWIIELKVEPILADCF